MALGSILPNVGEDAAFGGVPLPVALSLDRWIYHRSGAGRRDRVDFAPRPTTGFGFTGVNGLPQDRAWRRLATSYGWRYVGALIFNLPGSFDCSSSASSASQGLISTATDWGTSIPACRNHVA